MTHFKILFQIVLLIFLLNNSLFSKDNKLEFLQKKNSFIYISADSIKSFYKNLSQYDIDDRSYFDKNGNLIDHNGNTYILKNGISVEDKLFPKNKTNNLEDSDWIEINEKLLLESYSNVRRNFPVVSLKFGNDGDGVADSDDLDDDNDGILDSEEGLNCLSPVAIGPDGSFTPCAGVASNGNQGRNGNVTCGDWVNNGSTLDTWVTPRTRTNCGNSNGCANGLPESPDGGIVAGGWANSAGSFESFRTDIVGLLNPGQEYDIVFWQTFAGLTDGTNCGPTANNTPIGARARWRVEFGVDPGYPGAQTQFSPERTFEGPGNQTWTQVSLRFTAEAASQRLIFSVNVGTDGRTGPSLSDYMAIDGIEMFAVAAPLDCDDRDSDNDGVPDHLDLDSDGDGCNDVLEAGFGDSNGDGILGGLPINVDGDGKVTASGGYTDPADVDGIGGDDYIQEGAAVTVTSNPSVLESKQPGENVQFTVAANIIDARVCNNCKAAGVPAPIYQWQENTGGVWVNLANGGKYGGVLTNQLTITGVTAGMSGYKYRVQISTPSYICGPSITTPESQLNVNSCPSGQNDTYEVDEGSTININTAAGAGGGVILGTVGGSKTGGAADSDVDSNDNNITATKASDPSNHVGAFILNANGTFIYTHDGSETTTDSFTYNLNDQDGCATAGPFTVNININPVNDCPVGLPDTYLGIEGQSIVISDANGVIKKAGSADTDADTPQDDLRATAVTAPSNGLLIFDNDSEGGFTYTHNGSNTIVDSFTYTLDDKDGCAAAGPYTVTINITAVNDCPEGVDDIYTVDEGGTIVKTHLDGVIINDNDDDSPNANLRASLVLGSGPNHSASFTFDVDKLGGFTYQHDGSETLVDQFQYTLDDQDGCAAAGPYTVTININPQNDCPVGIDDVYSIDEGGLLNISTGDGVIKKIISADTDIDSDVNNLRISLVNPGTGPNNGSVTINADKLGGFTYQHDGSETIVDQFQYTLDDQDGCTAAGPFNVTINVTPVNDCPVAVDDNYTLAEGGTISKVVGDGVRANDTDAERDALTVIRVSDPAHGTLTLNPDGSFTYTHNGNESTSDSFTYKLNDGGCDSNIATVNFTITPVNDCPVAVGNTYQVMEGFTLSPSSADGVYKFDFDVDIPANSFSSTHKSLPSHGVLSCTDPSDPRNGQTNVICENGSFSYAHDGTNTKSDSFEYKISDGTCDSNDALILITIIDVNDCPTAVGETYTIQRNSTLSIDSIQGILINDFDPDNPLTIFEIQNPHHAIIWSLDMDGSFVYGHNGNNATKDSLVYKLNDGACGDSEIVKVYFNIVNDCPVAVDDNYVIDEGDTIIVDAANGFLSNDSDANSDVFETSYNTNTNTSVVVLSSENEGITQRYTGGYPISSNFLISKDEDYSDKLSFSVELGDEDIYDSCRIKLDLNSFDDGLKLILDGVPILQFNEDHWNSDRGANTTEFNNGGKFDVDVGALPYWEPWFGEGNPELIISQGSIKLMSDVNGGVRENVLKYMDSTVAGWILNESFSFDCFQSVELELGNTNSNLDAGINTNVQFQAYVSTKYLQVTPDGSFTYIHDGSETTEDFFLYKINDGICDSNFGTVKFDVTPINDCPITLDDSYTLNEGDTLIIDIVNGVLSNDSDAESDPLTLEKLSDPIYGNLNIVNDGSFSYIHDGSETTSDSFIYRVTDGSCNSNISKVSLTVRPINDCPEIIINPSKMFLNECVEESESFDMSIFFKDAENTPLVYGAKSSNTSLVKVSTKDSLLTFKDIGISGSSLITIVASDGDCETTLEFEVEIQISDLDGDGVNNCLEISNGTDPNDPCSYNIEDITLPVTATEDCDGDGVIDAVEINDRTDPNDPCSYNGLSISMPISTESNCPVAPYDGFSPDGDGINDTWVVPYIEQYPKSELIIYNRWGVIVYKTENYKSNWNGKNLPEGVYFYILNLKNGTKEIKGSIYLKRR